MSKLLDLKKWLSLSEAAGYLSQRLCESVTDADVLRLALDKEIVISVRLVKIAYGESGVVKDLLPGTFRIFPAPKPFEVEIIELLDDGTMISDSQYFQGDNNVVVLDGIFDLPMIGGEAQFVLSAYETLTRGVAITDSPLHGTFVQGASNTIYRLVNIDHSTNDRVHPVYPQLPIDCHLIVRVPILNDFVSLLLNQDLQKERAITGTKTIKKLDLQISVICATLQILELDLMNIPSGSKAKIKQLCLLNTGLFTANGFDRAWKEATKTGQIRVKDYNVYARK
ncbi:MAG: hypothetical protein H7A00_03320 [Hahellaceae bacterium]|nr:hypothetical protein [Hahellaceae bacterium]